MRALAFSSEAEHSSRQRSLRKAATNGSESVTVRFSTLSFFGAAGPCVLPSAALCSLQNLDDNQITSKTPIKYNRQLQPIDSILFD